MKSYYDAIVYADSDDEFNDMFSSYLSLLINHPKIISCEDGKKAFEQIQILIQQDIHQKILLICDEEMPYLSGIELSKKLKETNDHTKNQIDIILFTELISHRINRFIPRLIDYHIFKSSYYEQQEQFLKDLNSKGFHNLHFSNYNLSDQYKSYFNQNSVPQINNVLSEEEFYWLNFNLKNKNAKQK